MRGTARVLSVAAIALVAVAVRDAAGRARPYSLAAAGIVGCPPGGRSVPAGAGLQMAIDSARQGAVLCLVPGSYRGPVVIYRRLTLWGPPDAVVVSDGEGTTIRALADGAVLQGFAVRGSGRRYDKMDAAVYVHGSHVEVRDLAVARALFGIVVEQSDSVTIAGNHVVGLAELPVGIRGDGIRLWEVRHSDVVGNRLEDSRDILVWYSPDDRIIDNTVVRSRYGTHFMYSDGSSVDAADGPKATPPRNVCTDDHCGLMLSSSCNTTSERMYVAAVPSLTALPMLTPGCVGLPGCTVLPLPP